jgi:acetyl-CoA carboxylase biotin carboxyl carrier protein|tara:strand:- start:203 stop:412 length:210 start_codon:yes stop_codon:yes gene_type:complete
MDIKSQIQAVVWKINVKIGDKVNEGQEIIILESMKMEIPIISDISGIVKSILVEEGDTIDEDQIAIIIK